MLGEERWGESEERRFFFEMVISIVVKQAYLGSLHPVPVRVPSWVIIARVGEHRYAHAEHEWHSVVFCRLAVLRW